MLTARNGTDTSAAAAWRDRAEDLARWMAEQLVNRTDRCGKHYLDGDRVKRCADPPDGKDARDGYLDHARLLRHCRARNCGDVIGGFSYGPDKRGKWVLIDIDNHGGKADPEANRRFALHLYQLCADLGLAVLLYESNGNGGFHLWVLFDRPVPAAVLHAFGTWLVHDHAAHGFAQPPEVFPKNDGDTDWGHWVRFPGRHHKRDVWPSVYTGAAWAEGAAAVGHVLSLRGSDPALIPAIAAAYGVEVESVPARPPEGSPRDWLEPWQDYNRKATVGGVAELLERHGWTLGKARRRDGAVAFTRPGKAERDGESGNLLVRDGVPIFYNFSSESDLPAPRGFDPAGLLLRLEYGGEFARLNDELYGRGLGTRHPDGEARLRSRAAASANGTHAGEPSAIGARAQPARPEFALGGLVLRPGPARLTPSGRLTLPLAILRDSRPVDHVTLTSAASGRSAAARVLCAQLGEGADRAEVTRQLGEVLAAAAREVENLRDRPGRHHLCDVVRSEVPPAWHLTNATDRGAWSEARGREVLRGEFVTWVPSWLIDLAAAAANAPRLPSGDANRPALVAAVRCELEVLWADLLAGLGPAPAEDLAVEAAARKFRAALVNLWHCPRVGRRLKRPDGEVCVVPGSLCSHVKERCPDLAKVAPGPWSQIAEPYAAWWRSVVLPGGEQVIRLGMRAELCGQLKVPLPGVSDQGDLKLLGARYGLTDAGSASTDRARNHRGKQARLAVLSLALSEDLLAGSGEPEEDQPEEADLETGSVPCLNGD